MAHPHNAKQIEALAELIQRYAEKAGRPLSSPDATLAAEAVTSMFDLAGKGTLTAFKHWVLTMEAAGPYANEGGTDTQAENCAGEICC